MTVDKYADLITGKCRLNPFALSDRLYVLLLET